MRTWYLLPCLLLLSLTTFAQQAPSSQGTANDTPAGSGDSTTVVGCVTGVNGSFTLGTPNGDLYRLKGHHNALFHYNGMEVRVTGTVTPSKPSSASKRVSGTMPQTLKIAKIEKLRDTC